MPRDNKLRGALRQNDLVKYKGRRGEEIHPVEGSHGHHVYINGVLAAKTDDPVRRGGRVGEAGHEVYIDNRLSSGQGEPPPVRFHMHLDADRDGVVDDEWRRNDEWTWSRRGLGAIILVNLDPEGKYGPRDPAKIAPLVIRRDPTTRGNSAAGWTAYLRVSSRFKIRILDGRTAKAAVLLGPESKDNRLPLDLSRDTIELGMEGVQFPGLYPGPGRDQDPETKDSKTGFDGLLRLFLELYDPQGKLADQEVAQVRVAPWVVFNHFDPSKEIYVSMWENGAKLHAALQSHAGKAQIRGVVYSESEGAWVQDDGEFGSSSIPAAEGERLDSAGLLLLKNSNLLETASSSLLPFTTSSEPYTGNFLDYGGNFECTPPFVRPDNGQVYAFGRIYYGHPFDDQEHPSKHQPVQAVTRVFLDRQSVQEPFPIDVGWLRVGHVDEVVTCLPMKDARLGFRILIASPALALELVEGIADEVPIFGRYADENKRSIFDVDSYMKYKYPDLSSRPSKEVLAETNATLASLRANVGFLKNKTKFNVGKYDFVANAPLLERKIQTIRDTFKRELGLCDDDFIRLPVLFTAKTTQGVSIKAEPFTPDIINGLVITEGDSTWAGEKRIVFLAPKPFGPAVHADGKPPSPGNDCIFEEYVRRALGPPEQTGVEVQFADNFVGYHLHGGEVHCGTNTLRAPPVDRVWWAPHEDPRRKTS